MTPNVPKTIVLSPAFYARDGHLFAEFILKIAFFNGFKDSNIRGIGPAR
jgi:hypothetical protein